MTLDIMLVFYILCLGGMPKEHGVDVPAIDIQYTDRAHLSVNVCRQICKNKPREVYCGLIERHTT